MTQRRFLRRLVCLSPALLIPLATACEAVLDFDRTPLQPVLEASVGVDSATGDSGRSSSSSSSSSGSSSSSSTSSTSSSSSSSSGGNIQDAGPDADGGST